MEKTVIGLVAALSAVGSPAAAQAAVMTPEEANNVIRASSLDELLEPIPNAVVVLAALNAGSDVQAARPAEGTQTVQWYYHHHHHHWYHHHHHHWYHHHHHHHWYWHHHHHHSFWRWCYYHPDEPECD